MTTSAQMGQTEMAALAETSLANSLWPLGRLDEAAAHLRAALRGLAGGQVVVLWVAMLLFAGVTGDLGRSQDAAVAFGAADALEGPGFGAALVGPAREWVTRARREATGVLGDGRFAAVHAQGRGMTVEEVLDAVGGA